jgi:hypothetical protein
MMEVKIVNIDQSQVPVVSKTFEDFGYLTVTVGTNGEIGRDDDGTVTTVVLKPTGSFNCRAALGETEMNVGEMGTNTADDIRIIVHGNGELRLLVDALRFAVNGLEFLADARNRQFHTTQD